MKATTAGEARGPETWGQSGAAPSRRWMTNSPASPRKKSRFRTLFAFVPRFKGCPAGAAGTEQSKQAEQGRLYPAPT
jgi:hypothetical protein